MTVRNWKYHGVRLFLGLALLCVAGWLLGYPFLVLQVGLLAYLVWHLTNIWRLHRWLQAAEHDVPESQGIWTELFDNIRLLNQQSRKQESHFKNMIAEFQSLTNALPDATLVIDAHDSITWCNDSAIALLGLRIPEDLGQAVTNLLRGPEFSEWLSSGDRANRKLEMQSPLSDDRWWHVTSVPFQKDQWLIVLRDITEIHNVEQMRRDFIANISHELRTPVTVLLGYLELLHNHPVAEVAAAVERMQGQTVQMKALLDHLLELSRLQSDEIVGEEQDIDIPAMLEQLKETAEELSRGKHRLLFDIQPGLYLLGVSADIESAFRNLIINAIRYTPEDGEIAVTWETSEEGPYLSVADTGIGIPRRDLPRLTERFYRVGSGRGRQSGGTGLGLAIVKHVINAHKARLIIRSELGEGSEFICQFPKERELQHGGELLQQEA
ncbi:MAG TPA: phosphate regulon sensor histidine kinase PhoR [Xanthomonadales bacterium]|nr:phosphate regulon sensor histidine kinase PhoR [Xanthomonadales bacterium]